MVAFEKYDQTKREIGRDDDFELVHSPLSQTISVGADSVSVHIYGDGEGNGSLRLKMCITILLSGMTHFIPEKEYGA